MKQKTSIENDIKINTINIVRVFISVECDGIERLF